MDRVQKYAIGVVCVASALLALSAYGRIWEHRQKKQPIYQAEVVSIEPYSSHNDLHLSSAGKRIRIKGEDAVIDFSSKDWDKTVKRGDSVDLEVRRRFPLFEDGLEGITINDHK
jgi:hypothetical protein